MWMKLNGAAATLLMTLVWVKADFAQACVPGIACEVANPEINGSASIAALALVAGVVAMLYSKARG